MLILSSTAGFAQRGGGYTMNFMDFIPQQYKYNPAYFTRYGGYMQFPVPLISSFQFQLNLEAIAPNRFLEMSGGKKTVDPARIVSQASSTNNVGMEMSSDLIAFGFKVGENNQFHVGLGFEGYGNIQLTKKTLGFIFKGPGAFMGEEGRDALSGNRIDMSAYGVLSFGYSREINDKLSIGGRAKFLLGLANFHTERNSVILHIDDGYDPDVVPFTYTVEPDVEIYHSLPDGFPMFDNLGLGFDFGAVYQLNEAISFGASVSDIGFFNWTHNVKRITSAKQNRPFIFNGVDLDEIINDGEFDIQQVVTNLTDSLKEFFQLNETTDSTFTSYRTPLRTSINLSMFYDVTDRGQIGLMFNSRLIGARHNALTIAYTHSFGRVFQVSINNSMINEKPFNFGGGFALNLKAYQLYVIVDRMTSFRVIRTEGFNLQFGMNLAFNRTEKDPHKRRRARDFSPRDRTGYVNDRWAW